MVSQRQVASRREDSGFTRADAMGLLIALVLLTTFGGAWLGRGVCREESARSASCVMNLRNIYGGLKGFWIDSDNEWPRFYAPEYLENKNLNAFGRLYEFNYIDDLEAFTCPHQPITARLAPAWSGLGPRGDTAPSVIDSTYAYDNARIPPNAAPERVIVGDTLQKVRRPGAAAYMKSAGVPFYELCPPNHETAGVNVLYADGAVEFLEPGRTTSFWVPYQGLSTRPAGAEGSWTCYEEWAWGEAWRHYPLASRGRRYDFVRAGLVANPRLTGGAGAGADAASGNDTEVAPDSVVAMATDVDVFAIDAETPNQFALLGEWQFRTGWMRLDASNKENDDPASGALRVAMSKTDCAMQPGLGFRAGTGWPDSIYRVGGQTPATPREKWTPTEGIALAVPPRKPTSPWSPHAVWLCVGAVLTVLVVVAAALIRRRRVPPTG